jgi:hypothetical protein
MIVEWPTLFAIYKDIIGSAVGAGAVMVPIYIFGFRQTLEAKDALIERLRQENTSLEKDRVSEIIQEKNVLIADLRERANEKAEMDRAMGILSISMGGVSKQIEGQSEQIRMATAALDDRVRREQLLGSLYGMKMFLQALNVWQESMTIDKPLDTRTRRLNDKMRVLFSAYRDRIDTLQSGRLLTIEEARIMMSPFGQQEPSAP